MFMTNFETETLSDFFAELVRVNTANPSSRNKHQQAACIHRHSSGQLLISCRWDETAKSQQPSPGAKFHNSFGEHLELSAEGDDSNEQALYFSLNDGKTWTMANDGEPVITLRNGTSFDRPSSVTHSFIFENEEGEIWLYYTINQPFTWGSERPDRSTGGGEIRKIQVAYDGGTWRTSGVSEIVWGLMQPIDNGNGGYWDDVRCVCLNKIVKLSNGKLLMPVAGRTTVADPEGTYWKINRCWVLESSDGGQTWDRSSFIGGSDSMCLCEPTLVETATSGFLVAYMRVGYATGNQLYRSVSEDFGRTWSVPEPSGLPNTDTSGTKPCMMRLQSGEYVLLQTNEHSCADRTNMSIFVTDEEGIQTNRWKLCKVVGAECESLWKGSCYGSVDESPEGALYVAYVSFLEDNNYLNFAKIERSWLEGTIMEPTGIQDRKGNHLPYLVKEDRRCLKFKNVRSRANAPQFMGLRRTPIFLRQSFRVKKSPSHAEFPLIHVSCNHGRTLLFAICLRPQMNSCIWIRHNGGWLDTGIQPELSTWMEVECRIEDRTRFRVKVCEELVAGGDALFMLSDGMPDTYLIGGNTSSLDECELEVTEVSYGAVR